jgi:hypothetical protein
MARILLLLILFSSINYNLKGQNCTVNLTFGTQEAIDNFAITNPGCTTINGNVSISGGTISNLNGLSVITEITGQLNINNSPLLNSISGLSGITSIGSAIDIDNNDLLVTLTGLNNLSSIGGSLRIVYNNALTDITSLNKLTKVNGFLSVGVNASLLNLSGLEGITSIDGAISMAGNNALVNVDGLNSLTSIKGYLYVVDNPSLISLNGFNKITSIFGDLTIHNNDAITTLSGLDSIDPGSLGQVKITDCSSLSYCAVKSICEYISMPRYPNISGNTGDCADLNKVVETGPCPIKPFPVNLISFEGKGSVEGNKLTWKTASETKNAGFDVERSTDARYFEKVGFMEGGGTSSEDKNYSFIDVFFEPLSYYRLKQIDFDQTSTYSKIIAVKKMKDFPSKVSVYPNPSNGQIFIEAANLEQEYSIKTLNGKIIKEASKLPTRPIDTRNIQNGIYLLTIGNDVFKVMIAN